MNEEEKKFEERVSKEVQKRIDSEVEKRISDPRVVIAAYQKALIDANRMIDELQPKADFADAVMGSEEYIEMSAVAKVLKIDNWGRNNIFAFLRDIGVLRRNNEPYQQYVDRGYFKVIEQSWVNEYTGVTNIVFKTVVSQKGMDFIRKTITESDR